MAETTIPFTDDQVERMLRARDVIQEIDGALRDYQSYDPEQDKDLPPHLESMDKLFDDMGFRSRILEFETPSAVRKNVYLQRYCGEPDRKRLGKTWGKTLRGTEYAAYRKLNVSYVGKVALSNKGERDSDDYTIYAINEPTTLLHGLGVIIAARMTVKRELIPVEGSIAGDLTDELAIAAERLDAMASSTEDTEESTRLKEIAKAASRQKFIPSTSIEPVDGWHLASTQEAAELAGLISLAVTIGEDIKS